jgi:isopenicillin N synthase-like dioxygenase
MTSHTASFKSIPILDLALADDEHTKESFLKDLRFALRDVGFFYIKNFGIDMDLINLVMSEGKAFFELPEEKKLEIEMKNAPSFLGMFETWTLSACTTTKRMDTGYSRLGNEITRFKTDWREQIDLSTPHALPSESDPLYHNLLAPNQWPDPKLLPNFRPVFESYMEQMGQISMRFTSLIAEAIGLPSDAFDRFFDTPQQHKLKIVKYPDVGEINAQGETQGVGPHKDSMLTSYLLQASHHRGLQAQNHLGEWVDCPPIDGTLVVAIGQGMQAVTQGVCQRSAKESRPVNARR